MWALALRSRSAGGSFARSHALPPPCGVVGGCQVCAGRGWERARENKQWQRERRGKSRWWWWRIDRWWFVNLRGFDRSISRPCSPLWCPAHRERVSSSQVAKDKISCYPDVMVGWESSRPTPKGTLSGSSLLFHPVHSLYWKGGCQDQGGPGTEPCALLARDSGALSAICCRHGSSAPHADHILLSAVVIIKGGSKNLQVDPKSKIFSLFLC